MSVRVELTFPDDLYAKMESARGDVPRATWLKRAVEAKLSGGAGTVPARKAAAAVPDGLCKKHQMLSVRPDGRCGAPGCPG